ncbi:ATP-binding protein [Novosphingobium arvoryzae]|uniref:Histidine kinase n=1 Tax=Novosphingobium arvoryzae TaxID=1256514 RepID=A0A918R5R5_9SPHN|nr:ATP-binding protein [Novosphingobium arvoryzae]GGZ88213.1 histidine kinase [Novosphingobium arvoryzae]
MSHQFHITIGNSMDQYMVLAEALRAFASDAGLGNAATTHLELVIEELVVNIIKHGYADGRAGRITLDVTVAGDLTVTLVDDAIPFNPVAALAPDISLGTEERPIGGLGIHFVRTFMDEMRYRRDGGRNVLFLRKQLEPASGVSGS